MADVLSSAWVQRLAKDAGFDLCGLARAEPIPARTLTEWLEAGMAADMDWMAERALDRLDVARVLPGARTVVAFACSYRVPDEAAEGSPIARYARGRDYHATMKDRIRAFRRGLSEAHPEVETYASVDTGPFMEKVWAARAGLGYVGRNACFITEPFGSYVVLAVLVMTAEVDVYASGPAVDRCGACNLCVNACPTGAISEAGAVDARLCLSYQTIENRAGTVPEALRPAMENIVFGCDICQDVCPLNVSVAEGGARFTPRAVAHLGVREIAALSPEDYGRLVPGTPLARAKYDGLRRNAAYALGAARDAGARAVLERLAADGEPRVAEAARWALSRL